MLGAHTVICGAGILGLTIARELVSKGQDDILILEKECELGAHASGRNSGVLHAGIYYTPSSTRAKTCIEGNRRMRAYCKERGLPLKENGKVIVATSPDQLETLDTLYERAVANGSGARMVNKAELAEIEPHARTIDRAIHSPMTAVVNPKKILASLISDLTATGKVRILYETTILKRQKDGLLATSRGAISFKHLINVMGAHADTLAHSFGVGENYRLVPFKGKYKQLTPERSDLVRGSIYPVPDIRNPFLGVHFTRGVDGTVSIGPTSTPAFGRENYHGIEGMNSEALSILLRDAALFISSDTFRAVAFGEMRRYSFPYFFQEAQRLVAGLRPRDICLSAKVGIRPQLVDLSANRLVMDFMVLQGERSTHVLNAISPAFTSSMAFAEIIVREHMPTV